MSLEVMQHSLHSPYFIDRASLAREQPEWLQGQLVGAAAKILIVHGTKVLCRSADLSQPLWVSHVEVGQLFGAATEPVFLGQVEDVCYFVVMITGADQAKQVEASFEAIFEPYLSGAPMAQTRLRDVTALASFLGFWHGRHQVCGSCGSPTRVGSAGHMRTCSNESCGQLFFPNMDPAVIVLIEHGDRCLLGRQRSWREGMYSALAGFVEPGESLEAAVAREVQEEAGIQVEAITYHSSQAWLFPNSLMLGFTATACSTQLNVNTDELETADWFTREHVRANPVMLPRPTSIAYQLIQDWLKP
jgi:NAD+ diphosphatase